MESAGTYIALWTGDGAMRYDVNPEHWDELRRAYRQWAECRIDSVVEIETIDGADVIVAASRICDFQRSTPSSREHSRLHRAALAAEDPQIPGTEPGG